MSDGSSFSLENFSGNCLLHRFFGSGNWYISHRFSTEKYPMTSFLLFLKVLCEMSTSSITHLTISVYGIIFGLAAIRCKNEHSISKLEALDDS